MLSPRIYSWLGVFMTLISTPIGVLPFTWCSRRQLFVKSERTRRLCFLNATLYALWSLYLFFQLFRYNQKKDYNSVNLLIAFTTAILIHLETSFLPVAFEDELLLEVNSILIYFRHIESNYLIPNKQTRYRVKIIEFLLLIEFIGIFNSYLIECAFFLWRPTAPFVLGNVVPTTWLFSVRFFLLYFLPCYLSFTGYMVIYIHFSIGMIYGILLMPFLLHELNLSRKKYKSCAALRSIPNLNLEYRACQLLQQRFNGFSGWLLVPSQSLCGGLFVFASFVVIKHTDLLEGPATILMICFAILSAGMWGMALHLGGYVCKKGIKLLNSWKYCRARKWSRRSDERTLLLKYLRSSRPLVISFRKMYTIRKLTVLEFFKGLARTLMRALLTMETNQ